MLIGAFDSGLGGLLLIKALSRHFREDQFFYLVDVKCFPYGEKPVSAIRSIVNKNVQFLKQREVDFVIVACNTASTVLDNQHYLIPLLGVIECSLNQAQALSKSKSIGLLATEATVKSNAYLKKAKQMGLEIHQQACPLLAPIVQRGEADNKEILLPVLQQYLEPLLKKTQVDTIIMGCTHYLFVEQWIQKLVGPHIQLVGPTDVLIQHITHIKKSLFSEHKEHSSVKNLAGDSNVSIYINADRPQYRKECLKIMKGVKVRFL